MHCSTTRYVIGDHSDRNRITAMLENLNWPSLQERHIQSRWSMMYKIHYMILLTSPGTSTLPILPEPEPEATAPDSEFLIPILKLDASSFFPRTIQDCMKPSKDQAAFSSLNCFKTYLGVDTTKHQVEHSHL